MEPSHRSWIPAALVALAVLLSLFNGDALQSAGQERAARVVDGLARLGGLVSSTGEPTSRALKVHVVQDGGPSWVSEAVEAALSDHPAYEVTERSPSMVRIEVIADADHLALRGSLFRQGWNLGTEFPMRIRVLPWIPFVALALGWIVVRWRRRMVWGAVVTASTAVVLDRVIGWPADIPVIPWVDDVRAGPLSAAFIDVASRLPDSSIALGAGVVTLCAVLIVFDHRRSSGRGGKLMASGLLAVGCGAIGLEVAARCGLLPWIGTPAGAGAAFSMALAWGLQARTLPSA